MSDLPELRGVVTDGIRDGIAVSSVGDAGSFSTVIFARGDDGFVEYITDTYGWRPAIVSRTLPPTTVFGDVGDTWDDILRANQRDPQTPLTDFVMAFHDSLRARVAYDAAEKKSHVTRPPFGTPVVIAGRTGFAARDHIEFADGGSMSFEQANDLGMDVGASPVQSGYEAPGLA